MKRFFALLAILLLASCIDVDDFGTYWAKTSLDPAAKGNWTKIPVAGEDPSEANVKCSVTEKDKAYESRCDDNGKADSEPDYPVKTLDVSPYHFFAVGNHDGKPGGHLFKYAIKDDKLTLYTPKAEAILGLIQKNHPNASNIMKDQVLSSPVLKIKTFDDEVFKILSEIPDNETYWKATTTFQRDKN